MRVLVAGELNADLILSGYTAFPEPGKEVIVKDLAVALGSASAICAAGLAKLGNEVTFVGKTGGDHWGEQCIGWIDALGISTSAVIRDPIIKTGLTVSLTERSDRALITYPGAIAALRAEEVPDELLRRHEHLHVSSYYLQDALRPGLRSLFDRATRFGLTTSLDPGFDPLERWEAGLTGTLEAVDVFLPNEVELREITGEDDPAAGLEALVNGRTHTIAKLGRSGCMALDRGALVRIPGFSVDALDTTGAGDSFNAGFLHAWQRGETLAEAMRFGCACGALSTLGLSGTAAQPDERTAREFLAARPALTGAA